MLILLHGVAFLIIFAFNKNLFIFLLGILWLVIPYVMCKISKNSALKTTKKNLNKEQEKYILEVAKKTFDFFKDNLTEENNYLIPDNYQEDRKQKYIDRTSSTNIGLSFLAVITGVDLNFISLSEGIGLLSKMIETIDSLEKWNGHLYNWYNIKTKAPLIPRYISTVDSGNFVGYLYVVKAFLNEVLEQEYEENKAYAMKALKKVMRPELINRLDNILVFHALTKKDVEKIFDNLINDLRKRLATKGIGLKVDEKAKEWLIKEGYDPKNGARPLRRKIEDEVESLLSEEIISEKLKKGDIPVLKLEKNKLKLVKE